MSIDNFKKHVFTFELKKGGLTPWCKHHFLKNVDSLV